MCFIALNPGPYRGYLSFNKQYKLTLFEAEVCSIIVHGYGWSPLWQHQFLMWVWSLCKLRSGFGGNGEAEEPIFWFSSSWRQVLWENMAAGKRVHLPPSRPQLCHLLLLGVIYKNQKKATVSCSKTMAHNWWKEVCVYACVCGGEEGGVISCQLGTFWLDGMLLTDGRKSCTPNGLSPY